MLIDLRAVSYEAANETYILEDFAAPTYFWAANLLRPKSADAYAASQRRREEVGFAAELAVIDYERDRLGDILAHRVEHVSADQPYACFDIKSATALSDGQVVDRYIEVKAVPEATLQFYWSKAEVDAAKVLRTKYYLYLVPFVMKRGLDVDAVTIICDPSETLIGDVNAWEFETEVLVCRRKF